jgi:transcription antitermination factor NusG
VRFAAAPKPFPQVVQVDYGHEYRFDDEWRTYPPLYPAAMNIGDIPPRWYVACTVARHEKAVADRLRSRDVETYLPLYRAVRRWGKRRVTLDLPLFPGYVFVRTQIIRKARILDHPGVVRLVGLNGKATPLADEDIDKLRASLKTCNAEPYPYFSAGRRIRIKCGPLAGVEGTIIRRKGRVRLVVQIDLIQRAVLLELDAVDAQLTDMTHWHATQKA